MRVACLVGKVDLVERVLVGELDLATSAHVQWGESGVDVVAGSTALRVVTRLAALLGEAWACVSAGWADLVRAAPQETDNCEETRWVSGYEVLIVMHDIREIMLTV